MLALLLSLFPVQVEPVRVQGFVQRLTPTGVALADGRSYVRAQGCTVLIDYYRKGDWTDIRVDDGVEVTLDRQNKANEIRLLGKYVNKRWELDLRKVKPVHGDVKRVPELSINGRVFSDGCLLGWKDAAVFSNRDGWDLLEAWVGKKQGEDGGDFSLCLVVLGDGKELYRSGNMKFASDAKRVVVPIRGYTGVTILTEPDKGHVQDMEVPGAFAEARFVKSEETIKKLVPRKGS